MNPMSALLGTTSRTFALSIPFLPADLKRSVTTAYLIFRIVDTIEDEFDGDPEARAAALTVISSEFFGSSDVLIEEVETLLTSLPLPSDPDYAKLLRNAPAVLNEFQSLNPHFQRIIADHLARTSRGMAQYLGRDLSGGQISDLRSYCYIVAGIVGEMCSSLFVAHQPVLESVAHDLQRDSAAFGEGLQLVNIIRDAEEDLHAGRCYLPFCVGRDELIALARRDLRIASRYIMTLESASAQPGIVAFNAFNAALAQMTLHAIETDGVGAKVSREQVCDLHHSISERVRKGQPIADIAAADRTPCESRLP